MKLLRLSMLSKYEDKDYNSELKIPHIDMRFNKYGFGYGFGKTKSDVSHEDGSCKNVEVEYITSFSTPIRTYYYNDLNLTTYIECLDGKYLCNIPPQPETN